MNLRYLYLYHNHDIMIYIIKSINWYNIIIIGVILFWKYGILTKFEMNKMKPRTL